MKFGGDGASPVRWPSDGRYSYGGDTDFKRYKESYFDEFPGVWRQVTSFPHQSSVSVDLCWGRSDCHPETATAWRIGTSGDLPLPGTAAGKWRTHSSSNLDIAPADGSSCPLFVKLRQRPCSWDEGAKRQDPAPSCARNILRRHVPDKIYQVPDIPYTLTGQAHGSAGGVAYYWAGTPPAKAANRDAVAQSRGHWISSSNNAPPPRQTIRWAERGGKVGP